MDLYERDGLFERAASVAPYFAMAAHGLQSLSHVIDVRNFGLVAAVELEPRAGKPSSRAYKVFVRCFEIAPSSFPSRPCNSGV